MKGKEEHETIMMGRISTCNRDWLISEGLLLHKAGHYVCYCYCYCYCLLLFLFLLMLFISQYFRHIFFEFKRKHLDDKRWKLKDILSFHLLSSRCILLNSKNICLKYWLMNNIDKNNNNNNNNNKDNVQLCAATNLHL